MRVERTPEHQALRDALARKLTTGRKWLQHSMKQTPGFAWEVVILARKLGAFEPHRLAGVAGISEADVR